MAPGDLDSAVEVLLDHYEEAGARVLRLLAEEHGLAVPRATSPSAAASCTATGAAPSSPTSSARSSGSARDRRLAQLVAVCDVYTWKLLRLDSGLSRRQTRSPCTSCSSRS